MPEQEVKGDSQQSSLEQRELRTIEQKDVGQYSFIFSGDEDELMELVKRIAGKFGRVIKTDQDLSKERIKLSENWMIIPHTVENKLEIQFLYDIRNVSDDLKRDSSKLNKTVQEEKARMSDIILECMDKQ